MGTEPVPEPDRMTVLTTFGPLATKALGRDPSTGAAIVAASYGDAATFRVSMLPARSVSELHRGLRWLAPRPRSLVIRAELLPGVDPGRCRRLLHPMRELDGSTTQPTFREAARRWLACDFDSLPCPSGLDWMRDPIGTAEHLALTLPAAFHGVACVIQATPGAGVKSGIRARSWYHLDRAVSDAEAVRWLAASPVDRSLFRAVQAHYTAAPVLQDVRDPMPWRLHLVPGREAVAVPELPEPPPCPPLARRPLRLRMENGSRYALAALEDECRRVAHAATGDRHQGLNRAAFKLARFVASGELEAGDVLRCLVAAGEAAGLTDGEAELLRFLAFGLEAGLRGGSHAA